MTSTECASAPAIVWFRDDLRLADNAALSHAAAAGPVLALYVFDDTGTSGRPLGGAARWWLQGSLERLAADLDRRGVPLVLRRGPARQIVPAVAREAGARLVAWNRRFEAAGRSADADIAETLAETGIATFEGTGNLLYDPELPRTGSGGRFRVFTPFWRACRALPEPAAPLPVPSDLQGMRTAIGSDALAAWALCPSAPDWAGGLRAAWRPGEAAAHARLDDFLDRALAPYADARDFVEGDTTSRLSPHLRFGEITPRQILAAVKRRTAVGAKGGADKFLAEIGWRDFSWNLLDQEPDLATRPLDRRFEHFPWRDDVDGLEAWRRGRTGVPIVDAAMRGLWHTGFMHNRLRMVVASFLVKHLLVDWREGEAWFWDTLVDADPASNTASWQWVAGCGADAAPFVRVFNPVLQGERYDPTGAFVRRFVPEIAGLPNSLIHKPWEATALELAAAGIRLGETYPRPIVDLAEGRARALEAFEAIRGAREPRGGLERA